MPDRKLRKREPLFPKTTIREYPLLRGFYKRQRDRESFPMPPRVTNAQRREADRDA